MRYLIIATGFEPAFTEWFESENHFNAELDMIVIDLAKGLYTKDGESWKEIEHDHL